MLGKILLATFIAATMAVDYDEVGCGQVGEECCTQDFIEEYNDSIGAEGPTYYHYDEAWCWDYDIVCFENKCVRPKDLPCGQLNEPCCKDDEVQNDYFDECLGYDMVCSNGICTTEGQLDCGGHDEPCCDTRSDYEDECFDGLLCIDETCQG